MEYHATLYIIRAITKICLILQRYSVDETYLNYGNTLLVLTKSVFLFAFGDVASQEFRNFWHSSLRRHFLVWLMYGNSEDFYGTSLCHTYRIALSTKVYFTKSVLKKINFKIWNINFTVVSPPLEGDLLISKII